VRMKRRIGMAVVIVLAACGGAGSPSDPGDTPDARPHDPGPDGGHDPLPDGQLPDPGAQPTIFTIVLENQDYNSIVGSANAPYLNGLMAQYALATNYNDTNHPSLPNYLHMISGDDQYPGFIDIGPDQTPFFPADKANLGTQLEAASIPWRSYQESMGTPCKLVDDGNFAPRHDPFLYFTDMQASGPCAEHNVDFDELAADLASNSYRYMWITPNLIDDGHNPSDDPVTGLQDADAWMAQHVPDLLASDGYKAGGAVFITWDESENNGDERIPMIVVSTKIKSPGITSSTMMDHGAYLATVEDMLGLPRLPTVTSSPTLLEFMQ
jgi:hypothetical protein